MSGNERPSPALFFEAVSAYQKTAAIRAAVELDLFGEIAAGATSEAELAAACECSERGVRILCDYLAVAGFLEKTDEGWALTPDSATFLDSESPAYLGGSLDFLLSKHITGGFDDLVGAVRLGGTTASRHGTVAPEHPVWVRFARSMSAAVAPIAAALARLADPDANRELEVLDVAAGHGHYGIALARRNPRCRVTAVDWPNVLEFAAANAEAAGVGDRYRRLPGSALEVELGKGYDLVLFTNFLHHLSHGDCERLARRAHDALVPGGRVVILDFVPDDDRSGPPEPVRFALVMLATTPAGDAYTFREYRWMLEQAGFADCRVQDLDVAFERVITARKRAG